MRDRGECQKKQRSRSYSVVGTIKGIARHGAFSKTVQKKRYILTGTGRGIEPDVTGICIGEQGASTAAKAEPIRNSGRGLGEGMTTFSWSPL